MATRRRGDGPAPLPPFGSTALNRIPLERGLGSSSAAAVAGAAIASVDPRRGADDRRRCSPTRRGSRAIPTTPRPAVFGGFTIALPDGFVHRFDPHPDLASCRPRARATRLPTAEARRALPDGCAARGRRLQRRARGARRRGAHPATPRSSARRCTTGSTRTPGSRSSRRSSRSSVPCGEAGVPVCVSGAGPALLAFPHDPLAVPEGWRAIEPGIRSEGFELVEG